MKTLNGLILTGGFSTRMGRDKSLLSYHGIPQRDYLRNILQTCCTDVFLSCRSDQPIPYAWHAVVDLYDFRSPLNGIMSALQIYPDTAWLTLAVDMPQVDGAALARLVQHRNPACIATSFYNPARQQPEPLLTIWEPTALPVLQRYVLAGTIGPQYILNHEDIQLVQPISADIFANVNYPTDWPTPL